MTQTGRWQYFLLFRWISKGTDKRDVKGDWDFCEEGLIVVNGEIRGISGIIDIEASQIKETCSQSMSLERVQKEFILNAGNHTVLVETEIEREDGSIDSVTGTGFFVSENLILTAKHNVVPDNGEVTRIGIKYEGVKVVKPTDATFACELVDFMPRTDPVTNSPLEDLALLSCPAHYCPRFLSLSTEKLEKGMVVRIVGYPGKVTEDWLTSRHPSLKGDPKSNMDFAQKLLPRRTLTVTEGSISDIVCGCATYEISTVPGMSGGCLLHERKVCGVHLGHEPNTAVLFSDDRVREFLKEYKLLP